MNRDAEPIAPHSSQFVSAASLRLRLDWLNRLRWGAVAMVVGAVVVAGPWLGVLEVTRGLLVTAGGLAFLNLLYVLRNRRWEPTDIRTEIRLVKVQIVGDLFILTGLLNLTGGLENPFFFVYIIHVILASLLFKGREIYQIAALAIILFTSEVVGEYLAILPHHHLLSAGDLAHELPFALAGLGAFWVVMLTCAYLGASIMKHNRAIKDELVERQGALVQADAEKMDFFRFVTHEVKSPVSTAQSAVQAALELDDAGLTSPARGLLERGVRRLEQTNLMVRDLADLTRGGSPRQVEKVELDVGDAVARIGRRFAESAEEEGIRFELSAPSTPAVARLEADRLEKIVANLVSNAIRYSEAGGKVSVAVTADRGTVQLVVADEGIGIPPADQERIFEEFFRTDQARESSQLGTGLGLAIVRKFVDQTGGTLDLRSEVGAGSTFTVTWPKSGLPEDQS